MNNPLRNAEKDHDLLRGFIFVGTTQQHIVKVLESHPSITAFVSKESGDKVVVYDSRLVVNNPFDLPCCISIGRELCRLIQRPALGMPYTSYFTHFLCFDHFGNIHTILRADMEIDPERGQDWDRPFFRWNNQSDFNWYPIMCELNLFFSLSLSESSLLNITKALNRTGFCQFDQITASFKILEGDNIWTYKELEELWNLPDESKAEEMPDFAYVSSNKP